jgi:hypothetical protein
MERVVAYATKIILLFWYIWTDRSHESILFLFAAKTKYYMGVGRQYISMEEHSTIIIFAVIEEIRPTRTRNKKDGAQSG